MHSVQRKLYSFIGALLCLSVLSTSAFFLFEGGLQKVLPCLGLSFTLGILFLFHRSVLSLARLHAEQLDMAATHLKDASREQLLIVEQQGQAIEKMLETIMSFQSMAQRIANDTHGVSQLAEIAAEMCETGVSSVQQGQLATEKTQEIIETVSTYIAELVQKSQEIHLALDIIKELAEQTQILSYNANVEAAAAGEAGRGFAVVATQVGKLAEHAKDASRGVRILIEEVQESTSKTVRLTQEATEAVQTNLQTQRAAVSAIESIASESKKTLLATKNIEEATQEQSDALANANADVESIFYFAEESQKNAEQLCQTAEDLSYESL